MKFLLKLSFYCVAILMSALTTGCATTAMIDKTYTAKGQDSRVRFLILHYTTGNFESSLKTLTQGEVSSHYLVDSNPPKVYQLVEENRRAYHAGISFWKGATALNASSIGIEIVNGGGRIGADGKPQYPDFPREQIDAVIKLVQKIVKDHDITPDRVLGHSDIAPGRKTDPGPKFPWKRFADLGLVQWPDAALVAQRQTGFQETLPNIGWFQARLSQHGFSVPSHGELDSATRDVLVSFQMKYRPANFDGTPDAETAALLDVLTQPIAK